MIKTRWHAFLDYMLALLLIVSPWLFDFAHHQISRTISVAAGALILVMAIFSKNEGGLIRVLPMRIHLLVDVLLGIAVATASLIVLQAMPHVLHLLAGIMLICMGLFTSSKPEKHEIPIDIPERDAHIQRN